LVDERYERPFKNQHRLNSLFAGRKGRQFLMQNYFFSGCKIIFFHLPLVTKNGGGWAEFCFQDFFETN
jgi:hypothetical protein